LESPRRNCFRCVLNHFRIDDFCSFCRPAPASLIFVATDGKVLDAKRSHCSS
jgi:hypothetical protein